MDVAINLLFLSVGLLLGGVSVWLLLRARIAYAAGKATAEAESERAVLAERVATCQKQAGQLEQALDKQNAENKEQASRILEYHQKMARLVQLLKNERRRAQENLDVYTKAKQELTDAFQALAYKALQDNSESFLRSAKETMISFQESASSDFKHREQEIRRLVQPLRTSLDEVDSQIEDLQKDRVGTYRALSEQIDNLLEAQGDLRSQTERLTLALRAPQVRGRWGELQLKRVVELAGMVDRCDFYEQVTVQTDEGQLRPDLIVRLPGDRTIVVDAKVPLEHYLNAIETDDEKRRNEYLEQHARRVRGHISELSKKSYFAQFDQTPEFVVLFLPGEAFFSAALEQDRNLIEYGAKENVVLASPTTLIALLRAVAYGWSQQRLTENAKRISGLGQKLYQQLCTMGNNMNRLGLNLRQATDCYNQTVGTLERSVLASAREFEDLGVLTGGNQLPEAEPVETSPRELQAPEFEEQLTETDAEE